MVTGSMPKNRICGPTNLLGSQSIRRSSERDLQKPGNHNDRSKLSEHVKSYWTKYMYEIMLILARKCRREIQDQSRFDLKSSMKKLGFDEKSKPYTCGLSLTAGRRWKSLVIVTIVYLETFEGRLFLCIFPSAKASEKCFFWRKLEKLEKSLS